MLAMSIKAIADQARAKLRAIALANLKRGQDKRRETQPARTAAHREKQMARVRLALAQSNGNKAAATRLLGCGRPFLENYKRLIDEEDAAKPAARCPTCQQQMPILDSGRP
jgi:hypothetical protein